MDDRHQAASPPPAPEWQEPRFRGFLDTLKVGLAVIQDRFLFVNRTLAEMTGIPCDELLAMSPDALMAAVHPDDRAGVAERMRRCMSGEDINEEYEARVADASGSYRWLLASARSLTHAGRPALLVGYRNIDVRKRFEQELQAAESRWRSLTEQMPDYVLVINLDRTVRFANRVRPGVTHDRVIGRRIDSYLPVESRAEFRQRLAEVVRTGLPAGFRTEAIHSDGSRHVYDLRIGPLVEHGKTSGLILIFSDASERAMKDEALRESELRLREQAALLEQKTAALRELLEGVQREKRLVEERVRGNVQRLLLPLLEAIRARSSPQDRAWLDLLEQGMMQLASGFGMAITDSLRRLTRREIEVCNLIRGGLGSKEIAALLSISPRSVETHRYNIRKKLNISDRRISLEMWLASL